MDLWKISLNEYNNYDNKKYETLFTLANGYRGIRGALEFSSKGNRGNYIAGIFDKSQSQVTEIVNLQDPLGFNIYIEDEKVDMDECVLDNFNRELDMQSGVLNTRFIATTKKGKSIDIRCERFVSRNKINRWASKYELTPLNFNGKVFIENYIDGSVTNGAWDVMNKNKHFKVKSIFDSNPGIALTIETNDNNMKSLELTTLMGENERGNIFKTRRYSEFGETVSEVYETYMTEGKTATIFKYGISLSDKDMKCDLFTAGTSELKDFIKDGYGAELEEHKKIWRKIWDEIDIKISGDEKAQLGIRFNLFQLAASAYDGDTKVSIAAKALHGEGYKGHIFWDTEVFMLPFFIYTRPKVAKALLMYRYNTLKGARENAAITGYKGARFAWEAADEGLEVTPKWGFDYDGNAVRIWTGDEEYHINSDIAFGIVEYYRATNDKEFLVNYGIEILLDTAKFWQSRVEYSKAEDRYEISSVIGPDEFHEHVDNNVFTNYLAKWNIEKALFFKDWLKTEDNVVYKVLCSKLGLNDEDFKLWDIMAEKMYIPKSEDGMIIEQFQGYFDLADIKITQYDENEMPVWPDFEGNKLGETQLIKQADVAQLMIMLPEEFTDEVKKSNYEYYEKRTMHKSSLSPSMYSILGLAVGDRQNAYKYFMKAIFTDLEDNQGNTDFGLHAAASGGSWQSAIFGFVGLRVNKEGILNINPWLPEQWEDLSFNINWKGSRVSISILKDKIKVDSTGKITLNIYDKKYLIDKEKQLVIAR
ncbi:glycoside hydrolase family 65 protein [Clostridium bowmanii]|uniref:glycoside hydrolase family 65 protein n=1 Tax=Clostridium bowmanii TaxID=132925 RepID=UPI001CD28250|nr:glycosyl hydrolase family 65 protein [Clostridium bowmanii]MCA1072214.1 glycoside hydrolase family 65 protein [Clostridium bowmanii]